MAALSHRREKEQAFSAADLLLGVLEGVQPVVEGLRRTDWLIGGMRLSEAQEAILQLATHQSLPLREVALLRPVVLVAEPLEVEEAVVAHDTHVVHVTAVLPVNDMNSCSLG